MRLRVFWRRAEAPMLAVTFTLAATNAACGVLLLAVYGIGHCSVIVIAGTSTELVQRYLNWNEESKGADVLKEDQAHPCSACSCGSQCP
jgi:cytochrome c biogenesis protein CcdA